MSCNGSSVYHLEPDRILFTRLPVCLVIEAQLTHEVVDLNDKQWELEMIVLGPNSCNSNTWNTSSEISLIICHQRLKIEACGWFKGTLKEVLIAIAKPILDDDLLTAEWPLSKLCHVVRGPDSYSSWMLKFGWKAIIDYTHKLQCKRPCHFV